MSFLDGADLPTPFHNNSVNETYSPDELNNQRRQFLKKMLSENKGTAKRLDTTISDDSYIGISELWRP